MATLTLFFLQNAPWNQRLQGAFCLQNSLSLSLIFCGGREWLVQRVAIEHRMPSAKGGNGLFFPVRCLLTIEHAVTDLMTVGSPQPTSFDEANVSSQELGHLTLD